MPPPELELDELDLLDDDIESVPSTAADEEPPLEPDCDDALKVVSSPMLFMILEREA